MSAETAVEPLHGPGLTDVRMMTVAHTSFRRELKLAVPAVRGARNGDRRRVAEVADHVELWLGLVQHHHSIEDELLWNRLTERVPAELEPLVELMEQQHHGVAGLFDQSQPLVAVIVEQLLKGAGMPTQQTFNRIRGEHDDRYLHVRRLFQP